MGGRTRCLDASKSPSLSRVYCARSGGHHRYAIRSFAPHGGRGSWGVWGNANRGAAGPSGTQQTSGGQAGSSSSALRLRGRQILDHEALTCLLVRRERAHVCSDGPFPPLAATACTCCFSPTIFRDHRGDFSRRRRRRHQLPSERTIFFLVESSRTKAPF